MRKLVLAAGVAFATMLFASGCKHPGSQKLTGRWKGSKADGVSADQQMNANVFASGTEIIAKDDQIAVTTPIGKPVQATYTVDSEDKTSVTIHTDKDGPAQRETFTFSDDGNTMTWKVDPGSGRTITFARVSR